MAQNKLKAIVDADTSRFKKGMKESKDALKDFEKQGSDALSGLTSGLDGMGDSFGDIGKNIKNATNLILSMGSTGGKAMSDLDRALVGLKGAIAGLGISAAIAGFKELNRSADIFRATIEGTNLELQTKAYVDTFRASMEESLGNGRELAGFTNQLKRDGTQIASTVGNLVAGTVKSAWQSMASFEGPGSGLVRLYDTWNAVWDASSKADTAARNSYQYQGELNRALDERLLKTNEWKDLQYQIAANERIAADTSNSQADREKAVAEARRLQTQLSNEQVSNAQEILRWTTLVSREAENSKVDTETLVAAEGMILDLKRQQEEKMRSLDKLQNRITKGAEGGANAAKETKEATELTLEAATALVEKERALKAIQDQNSAMKAAARFRMDGALPGIETPGNLQASANALTIPAIIKPELDTQGARLAILDLTDIVLEGSMSMTSAIGELLGDLATGGDAWGNFANSALSTFADMAISVGKMAVATGAAAAGIQVALESLNPAVAMAAGAALIALGSAVKAGLSNVAGGNYSASASVASSAYSGGSSNTPTAYGREMTVHVTGTLTGEGSKLVAVLNNEADRKRVTT